MQMTCRTSIFEQLLVLGFTAKCRNHRIEMQDSLLLLTLGENQVVESCDAKIQSKVEEMDDSDNAGTSSQLQVNERNDSEMRI